MAVSARLYGKIGLSLFAGGINWTGGTIKGLLTADGYTPNQDAHRFLSDVSDELSGSGYARVTVPNRALTYDSTTKSTYLDCDPFSFAALTGSYRYMVIFQDTGSAGTSPLIGWVDFGEVVTVTSAPVNITPPLEGLFAHDVVA